MAGPEDEVVFCAEGRRADLLRRPMDRCGTQDAGTIESFTIVTQPAGAPLNSYHNREPVVLEQKDWADWLDLDADVMPLLGPDSADRFNVQHISGPIRDQAMAAILKS